MKKIAIFTEGQTELVFVRELLLRLADPSKLSIECLELLANNYHGVPYKYSSPTPEYHFLIVDVHGDEGVLSSIGDRAKQLVETGKYDKIIGLRDMYSGIYKELSPGVISNDVTQKVIDKTNIAINEIPYRDRITLHFAIMETEAWFLGMYNVFQKCDRRLTTHHIMEKLGIDLVNTDPQTEFYHPADQINEIFELCTHGYRKRKGDTNLICTRMDSKDFENAVENNRCNSFNTFLQEIQICCQD